MCCDHGPTSAGRSPSALVRLLALAAASIVLVGVALAADQADPKAGDRPPGPAPRVDAEGVPLPAGVIVRLGSNRLRHPGPINAVAVAPDGRTIASGGPDGLRVWEAATGKLMAAHTLPDALPYTLGFAADGRDLLCLTNAKSARGGMAGVGGFGGPGGGRGGVVATKATPRVFRRLDATTGQEKLRVDATAVQTDLLAGGRRFASADDSGTVTIVDAATGHELHRLANLGTVRNFAVSPNDRTLAVVDGGDTIALYDVASGTKTGTLTRENAKYTTLAISPDGRTLAGFHYEPPVGRRGAAAAAPAAPAAGPPVPPMPPEIHLWDLETRQFRCQLTKPANSSGPMFFAANVVFAFSHDGKTLATLRSGFGSGSGPVLWDAATGREIRRLPDASGVSTVAFSPDDKTFVGGTSSGTVVLWDVATGRQLPSSAEPAGRIDELTYADGGRQLISRADRFTAWDVTTGRAVGHYPPVAAPSLAALSLYMYETALSPDRRLVVGIAAREDRNEQVRVWDAATGLEVRSMEIPKKAANQTTSYDWAVFARDGRRVMAYEDDTGIEIWEVATGRKLATLTGHDGYVDGLVVSPDGRRLASYSYLNAGNGNEVRVWDLTTYQQVQHFITPSLTGIAFAPDSRRLAAVASGGRRGGNPASVQLWDIESGRQTRTLQAEQVDCVAISPDGRTLATGGYDTTVRLWEIASGNERHRFTGHTTNVGAVAYAPDGRSLAAASNEAPIYIWDVFNPAEFAGRAPTAAELEQAWAAFAGTDAPAAFQALRRLSAAPDPAVTFLRELLKPAVTADSARVRDLVRRLDSDRFVERQQAALQLEQLGEPAAAELRAALKDAASAEVQQTLQRLLDTIASGTPETLRSLRAVEALEYIGTPSARAHLKALVGGAAGAALTDAAAEALRRLEK